MASPGHAVAYPLGTRHTSRMPSLKAPTAERTGDANWRRLRPPLMALTDEERAALLQAGEGLAQAS